MSTAFLATPRRTLEFGEFIGVRSMRKSWDGSIDFYWLNEDLGATGYRKLQKILIHFKRTLDDFPLWSWEEPCFSRFFLSDRVSIQEWKPLIDRRYLHLQSITWHVDKIALNSFNWLTIIHLSSQKTQYVCMYLYLVMICTCRCSCLGTIYALRTPSFCHWGVFGCFGFSCSESFWSTYQPFNPVSGASGASWFSLDLTALGYLPRPDPWAGAWGLHPCSALHCCPSATEVLGFD